MIVLHDCHECSSLTNQMADAFGDYSYNTQTNQIIRVGANIRWELGISQVLHYN